RRARTEARGRLPGRYATRHRTRKPSRRSKTPTTQLGDVASRAALGKRCAGAFALQLPRAFSNYARFVTDHAALVSRRTTDVAGRGAYELSSAGMSFADVDRAHVDRPSRPDVCCRVRQNLARGPA